MKSRALVVAKNYVIRLAASVFRADAQLARDVPDQVRIHGLVARNFQWREVAIERVIDAESPMRMQARREVVIGFCPAPAGMDPVEREEVRGLQHAAIQI